MYQFKINSLHIMMTLKEPELSWVLFKFLEGWRKKLTQLCGHKSFLF